MFGADLSLPQFGFRTEGATDIGDYAQSPFYFRRPTELDSFAETLDFAIPTGQEVAGVWFFNSINDLTNSFHWGSFDTPQFITRIRIAALKDVAAVIEDPLMDSGRASIALKFYNPAASAPALNEQFVKQLIVPDDLIDIWIGDQWVKKNELSLLDFDDIVTTWEKGEYEAPSIDQSTLPVGNEPYVRTQKPEEDWRQPPANSAQRVGTIGKIVQVFRAARHGFQLRNLRERELQFASAYNWHDQQAASFREDDNLSGERVHVVEASFRKADVRRFRHEQRLLLTGKSFWQLHELDAWAKTVMRLERIGDSRNRDLLYTELPGDAIPPLVERIQKIKHEMRHARYRKARAKIAITSQTADLS